MSKDVNKLIEQLSNLTILEASNLVTVLKEKWNVSDAPMMVASSMAAPSDADSKVEEAKTNFDVVLASIGSDKINVIKVIREITGLGIREAKDLVEAAPKLVKEGATKEDADSIKSKLENVGAKVELK